VRVFEGASGYVDGRHGGGCLHIDTRACDILL
jgi:hypothetical protein